MPGEDRPLIDILHGARGEDTSPELVMFDLPDFFGATNPQVAQSPKKSGKLAMDINCVSFSKVFVLWRPWENCKRCLLDFSNDKAQLPEIGDYTCPHVQEQEYKAIKDMCLSGEAVLQKEEFFNVRSSDARCVHILWWRLDDASLEKMRQRKSRDAVYPPNPEAAFAEGKEKKKVKKTVSSGADDKVVPLSTPKGSSKE